MATETDAAMRQGHCEEMAGRGDGGEPEVVLQQASSFSALSELRRAEWEREQHSENKVIVQGRLVSVRSCFWALKCLHQ